jgi:hypothetical protein
MGIYGKLSGGDIPLPKIYPTEVLSEKQLEFIASHLPELHAATGCPAYSNRELTIQPGLLESFIFFGIEYFLHDDFPLFTIHLLPLD